KQTITSTRFFVFANAPLLSASTICLGVSSAAKSGSGMDGFCLTALAVASTFVYPFASFSSLLSSSSFSSDRRCFSSLSVFDKRRS
ncbi:hypothetical protein PFISCL1PPCAC_7749, partial [Pristionchus fissidentatus]